VLSITLRWHHRSGASGTLTKPEVEINPICQRLWIRGDCRRCAPPTQILLGSVLRCFDPCGRDHEDIQLSYAGHR
jgi:hypothetical protein